MASGVASYNGPYVDDSVHVCAFATYRLVLVWFVGALHGNAIIPS
jgi:hypothetical protein